MESTTRKTNRPFVLADFILEDKQDCSADSVEKIRTALMIAACSVGIGEYSRFIIPLGALGDPPMDHDRMHAAIKELQDAVVVMAHIEIAYKLNGLIGYVARQRPDADSKT
jgi:hypothetical protein